MLEVPCHVPMASFRCGIRDPTAAPRRSPRDRQSRSVGHVSSGGGPGAAVIQARRHTGDRGASKGRIAVAEQRHQGLRGRGGPRESGTRSVGEERPETAMGGATVLLSSCGEIIGSGIEGDSDVTFEYGQRKPLKRGRFIDVAEGEVVEKTDIALLCGGVISCVLLDDVGGSGWRRSRNRDAAAAPRRKTLVGQHRSVRWKRMTLASTEAFTATVRRFLHQPALSSTEKTPRSPGSKHRAAC